MVISAALISILAATAAPQEAITVVGHAWAPFISPMGEPFSPRSENDDTLATWFRLADRNHDGELTQAEMQADAERFFAKLDTDHNGEIDPDELARYEWQVAPEIQVNARTRLERGEKPGPKRKRRDDSDGPQGAARYALLNIPQPVAAADLDLNRGVSLAEFKQAAADRFALLDTTHRGAVALGQLETLRVARLTDRRTKRAKEASDTRVGVPLPPGQ